MNSNFFRHTFKTINKLSFSKFSYFKLTNTSLNSQRIKINYLNLFYNQRVNFLSKCTTLVQLFKTPAILSSQAGSLDEIKDEENLLSSILIHESISNI